MTQSHEIHRHADGTLDFDYYRAQIMAVRAEALRNAFKLKAAFGFVMTTITLIVCVTIAASGSTHWSTWLVAHAASAVSAGVRSVQ